MNTRQQFECRAECFGNKDQEGVPMGFCRILIEPCQDKNGKCKFQKPKASYTNGVFYPHRKYAEGKV